MFFVLDTRLHLLPMSSQPETQRSQPLHLPHAPQGWPAAFWAGLGPDSAYPSASALHAHLTLTAENRALLRVLVTRAKDVKTTRGMENDAPRGGGPLPRLSAGFPFP